MAALFCMCCRARNPVAVTSLSCCQMTQKILEYVQIKQKIIQDSYETFKKINTLSLLFTAILFTPSLWAMPSGDTFCTRLTKVFQRDINAKDSQGETAFSRAIHDKELVIAKRLLQKGANVDIKDEQGMTLFAHAVSVRNFDIADFLLEHGADINTQDASGRTPLRLAGELGDLDTMEYLLKCGADFSKQVCNGQTLFAYLMYFEDLKTAKFLLKYGADINEQNGQGRTLLMEAILAKEFNIVEFLINHGADTSIQDNEGHTAFTYVYHMLKQHFPKYCYSPEFQELFKHLGEGEGERTFSKNKSILPRLNFNRCY